MTRATARGRRRPPAGAGRRRTGVRVALLATLLALGAAPAHGYLKLGVTNGVETRPARWSQLPIRYFVSETSIPGVSAIDLEAAVQRALSSWQDVPNSNVAFERVGFTSALPGDEDGVSVIGFRDRPDLERTLAATQLLIDEQTGAIVEADIFFNSSIAWSVAGGGDPGRFDLESIALHETGHLIGLGHSALGETELRPTGGRRVIASGAAMFPIAFGPGNIELRALRPDDMAGAFDLYPEPSLRTSTGTIAGRITKDGAGVRGAHVVAYHLASGRLVGNFSLDASGAYAIAGLEPGPHLIRVEPLDDAAVDSFFRRSGDIDVDFGVSYGERLAIVPRGGGATGVDIRVDSK